MSDYKNPYVHKIYPAYIRVYFLNDGTDEIFNTNHFEFELSELKELGPKKFFYEKLLGLLKEWFDDDNTMLDPEEYKTYWAYHYLILSNDDVLDGNSNLDNVIPDQFFVNSDRFIEALDFAYRHID